MIPPGSLGQLRQLAGSGGYQRGVDYADRGFVRLTRWDAAAQTLNAEVDGSGRARYHCRVRFDGARIMNTTCSCPVATACKHLVAAMIVAERDDLTSGGTGVSATPATPNRSAPLWRTILPARSTRALIPLALGIELRTRPHGSAQQWKPEPPRSATPRGLVREPGEVMLAVRPLMRSTNTDRWIKGDATWDALRRSGQHSEPQRRWFTDFLNISRDSLLSGTAGEWILLDRVESPLLWRHLDALSGLGIPLVPLHAHTHVTLASAASAGLRIAEEGSGGLEVAADVSLDGIPVDSAHVQPLGRFGLYHWDVIATDIHVTLAAVDLPSTVLAVLRTGAPISVPPEDRGDFFAEAYPLIARESEVRAASGLELPPLSVPRPVLTAAFSAGDRIDFRFGWEYAGFGVTPFEPGMQAFRDFEAESTARIAVESIWHSVATSPFAAAGRIEGVDAAEWAAQVLTAYEDSDVRVVITGRRRDYRELSGIPEITISTVETTDADWFDLGIIVKIDGRSIPFTPLFTALSMRRTKLLLIDGTYFSLAHPGLDRLRELIDEATGLAEWETAPRISRHQVDLWEEFEDLADISQPAVAWRALAEGLRDVDGVPETPVPTGLHAQLREYQKQGFDWLVFLWERGMGGILADDMGLGKTLQLLALTAHAVERGEQHPFLVIAPTSVLDTWRREAARFAPGLRVTIIDSTIARRSESVAEVAGRADLVITSYTLARLDEQEYAAVAWAGLILDEAQFVKNSATKLHRAVAAIAARVTFAVTGTPLENSLTDLWSLFALTAPGLFPSARKFRQDYVQPIEKGKVPENEEGGEYRQRRMQRLRRRIRPLMLRRTKELVAADLPEKQVQEVFVDLSPAHRALYDTVLQRERQKVLGLLADLDRNRFIVFRSLTMLRMLALDPALVKTEGQSDKIPTRAVSRKLDVLLEQLGELRAEGHRALVFSQFTSFLELAAERLADAGISYAYLDGSTRRRADVVEQFRGGEEPVFLISLKAGGFGLTLTEADYVFLLDPWWNPAAESQAIDRVHRIGQQNRVFVYRLIAAGTIEEKVLALQQRKARLFSAVMDDDAVFAQALTADDIRGLLEA
ncbi:Probable helicase [Microbacterium esteraromaticum]|uniref:Probable helicase n=1 Tax=Microbacterium esteraromaticum TaxID=57043 RepID=A0A1R4ISQ3_9MICO|nr:DEAD/DEAH box helicase [Microbacterium esteraromaticum]SJN22689.1 Probable helicase [Microbacterium esteraromaticum]